MSFGLLGPLEVRDGSGALIEVRGRQSRVVLSTLLVAGGRAVAVDTLVEALWGDDPPATANGTLQTYVSRLRRTIEPAGGALVFDEAGYRLVVDERAVDLHRFEVLAERGRALLDSGDALQARAVLVEANALWRGAPLAELADVEGMVAAAHRLEERRLVALEDRVSADLLLGHHSTVAAELAEVVARHPLRESLQHQLALALYRSGRQADALRALNDAATTLREDLGIEPSRQLRDLEAAILAHDPALDLPETVAEAPRGATAESGLKGRGHELEQLIAAFDEAAAATRFVVVEGEPGIGKTRLAEELVVIAGSRGATVAWGRADERGAAPALWPWLAPLRTFASVVGDAGGAPAVLGDLLDGGDAAGTSPAGQFATFEAVEALIERAAEVRRLVIVLDDIQWADPTSLELLGFLARGLRCPVLVVALVRELEVGRRDTVTEALSLVARAHGSRRISLRGLTLEAMSALVATGDDPIDGDVLATIHHRSDGNPFYALELARLLHDEAGTSEQVPATVGDVIRRRLATLPPDTIALLEVAAVLGRDVDLPLLARAANLSPEDCADRLDPALVGRVLVEVADEASIVRFSHALVREVLLDGLTSLRRARVHLRIADAMESTAVGIDDIEVLADHLWRAASVGAAGRAVDALERGAEVAAARVAYPTAESLLTRSVQLRRATSTSTDDLDAELASIVKLLGVMRATHYFQSSDRDLVQRAEELAHRLGREDVALDMRWLQCVMMPPGSREMARMAGTYHALTSADPRRHVQAWGEQVLGVWCWGSGQMPEAVGHFDTALALLAADPLTGDVLDSERALITRRFAIVSHAMLGDRTVDESFAALDQLIDASSDSADIASLCSFGCALAGLSGRWDDMDRFQTLGLAADESSQFAFWGGHLVMAKGIVLAHGGATADGLEVFDGGRARFLEAGGTSALAAYDAFLAMVAAQQGSLDVAALATARARAQLDLHQERWTESSVCAAEAMLADAVGEPERAQDRIRRAMVVADEQHAEGFVPRLREIAALITGAR